MEVASGIHRLTVPLGDRIVCVVLAVSDGEALLLDTAVTGAFETVVAPYLDELGVTPAMLRQVVSSHADFDHVGASAEVRNWAPEAAFLCHALDRQQIEDVEALIGQRYGEFGGGHGLPSDPAVDAFVREATHTTRVDRTIEDGDVLAVGSLRLQVMHVPGHSPGHIALFEPASRCALIADAVLGAALETADGDPAFPPTYRQVDDYLTTIERLATMDIETLVTGHFPVMRSEQVQAFFADSRQFTELVDAAMDDALQGEPKTTPQLVEELAPVLGDWPTAAGALAVYPIVGHLEQLEGLGRVTRFSAAGRLTLWQRSSASPTGSGRTVLNSGEAEL